MEIRVIDFSSYSSLGIGPRLPVRVIGLDDLGLYLDSRYGLAGRNSPSAPLLLERLSFGLSSLPFNSSDRGVRSIIGIDSTCYRVIGRANNLLVSGNTMNLAVLGKEFDYIVDLGCQVEVGSAVSSGKLFRYFKANNLTGFEFIKNLPGSVGALTNMNAGMKHYEMSGVVTEAFIDGRWLSGDELGLVYRGRISGGVILAIRVKKVTGFRSDLLILFDEMRSSHPTKLSCGSCFKNPPDNFAARLIQSVGMKGYYINGVGFSEEHANFLVNKNGRALASFDDAYSVVCMAKERVFNEHGVNLECEVEII